MQLGSDLDGEQLSNSFGASVDLSSIVVDETSSSSHISIAVGGYGYARMFDYTLFDSTDGTGNDNTIYDGEWMPLSDRIDGDALYDEFAFATSLSANGQIVAFGAPSHKYDAKDGSDDTHGLVKVTKPPSIVMAATPSSPANDGRKKTNGAAAAASTRQAFILVASFMVGVITIVM